MSCKVQQSVCSDCVTYVKSRIKFNTFNTFNNVITKEQYIEIIEQCENYIKKYGEIFEKPMSKDFQDGMVRVIDLIKPLVKKD